VLCYPPRTTILSQPDDLLLRLAEFVEAATEPCISVLRIADAEHVDATADVEIRTMWVASLLCVHIDSIAPAFGVAAGAIARA
jgi:hypothetical protein